MKIAGGSGGPLRIIAAVPANWLRFNKTYAYPIC
jgi:hypothetical protein